MVNNQPNISFDLTEDSTRLVEDQLNRILVSKHFKSAKQMKRFLIYIVKKTLAEDVKELKQYKIGVDALLFAKDFNPDENPAVRIMGCRVRQRLEDYYSDDGNNNEIIISIPKGSYIPLFKRVTPKKNTVNENSSLSKGPILALVSLTDKTQSQKTNRLLLQNSDNLATEFSHFMCLKLVVCNPYADKDQSYLLEAEMKSTFSADYILALYLQKEAGDKNKYRLIYRLIHAEAGEILWAENYAITEKNIEEGCRVVNKIATRVADHHEGIMHIHWSRKLLTNLDFIPIKHKVLAYFRNYRDLANKETLALGVNACLESLKRNPNDVIASLVYAAYCRLDYVYGYGVIKLPLKKGKECIETAMILNPNSPEVHFVHGLILFCQNEWDRCVEEFELARSLCSNNLVIEFSVGLHYYKMEQWEKSLQLIHNASLLSTTYPSIYHFVPFLDFYRHEKYEQALYEAKKITTPGLLHGPLSKCVSYAQLGKMEEAEVELQEVLSRCPQFMQYGKKYLTRYLGSKILVDMIWLGVQKLVNNKLAILSHS